MCGSHYVNKREAHTKIVCGAGGRLRAMYMRSRCVFSAITAFGKACKAARGAHILSHKNVI